MPHVDKVFTSEEVQLDGETFIRCFFRNCNMTYSGGEPVTFEGDCKVEGCSWSFDGAASRTLGLLQMLTSGSKDGAQALEKALDSIGVSSIVPAEADETAFYFMGGHHQHSIAITQILAIASVLEFSLCNLFAWMIHCDPMNAAAAFYALQNNKARTDMIRDLIPHLHTEQEREDVRKILELAGECFERRNYYAHALWQRSGEKLYKTESLKTRYPHGTKSLVKLQTVTDDLTTMRKNHRAVGTIIEALSKNRPLSIAQKALKPSFAPILLSRSQRRVPRGDPKRQAKSE